jgi:hypothetical protein
MVTGLVVERYLAVAASEEAGVFGKRVVAK